MKMKTISLMMSTLLFLFFAVSCGSEKSKEEASEKSAEKFVENLMEKSTDGKVNVDIDQSGESTEMTIEGENGETVTVNVNSKEVPKNFPKDIYVIQGEIEAAGSVKTEVGELLTLVIKPKSDIKQVKSDILKEMKSKGWVSTLNMDTDDNTMQMFTKGDQTATITITNDNGKSEVAYSVTINLKK